MSTEPTTADVVQEEDPAGLARVPVTVEGPVRVVDLPAKAGGLFTVAGVGQAVGVRILSEDPRRKHATVLATDQNVRYGASQAAAENGGALWPANIPLVWSAKSELWATAVTSTTAISVVVEQWAD